MENFWKAAAIILVTAILSITVGKRDISSVLSVTACCMVAVIAAFYLSPVLDMLWKINGLGNLREEMLRILLKSTGVGILSELVAMVCTDMGNQSLAKMMQMLGSVVILNLSLPLFESLLTVIQNILENI